MVGKFRNQPRGIYHPQVKTAINYTNVASLIIYKEVQAFHRILLADKDDYNSKGPVGPSRIVSIENTDCSSSICSADVVLTASLQEGMVYRC